LEIVLERVGAHRDEGAARIDALDIGIAQRRPRRERRLRPRAEQACGRIEDEPIAYVHFLRARRHEERRDDAVTGFGKVRRVLDHFAEEQRNISWTLPGPRFTSRDSSTRQPARARAAANVSAVKSLTQPMPRRYPT